MLKAINRYLFMPLGLHILTLDKKVKAPPGKPRGEIHYHALMLKENPLLGYLLTTYKEELFHEWRITTDEKKMQEIKFSYDIVENLERSIELLIKKHTEVV